MDLTDEQAAVRAAAEIEQQLGVQDAKILNLVEFTEDVETIPEWLDSESENFIIRTELYGDPELPMVKTVSDIMKETQSQVYLLKEQYTFYICPTTNTFDLVDQIQ